MDREKIKEIIEWPSMKSVFEVRSFHGLASFYRKFIRNFSNVNASIIDTIKNDKQPFKWTVDTEKNFRITEKPILILCDFNKPFQVKCDASGEAIGVVFRGQLGLQILDNFFFISNQQHITHIQD